MGQLIKARGFDAIAERFIARAERAAPRVIGDGMQAILEDAEAQWPVRSGKSRDAFRFGLVDDGSSFSAEVRNTSGYAQFINGGRTYEALVTQPFRRFLQGLPRQLARSIVEDDNG